VTRALADTSVFIGLEAGRLTAALPDELELAVSVISVGELHAGVLAAADDLDELDRRLATYRLAFELDPLPVDVRVATEWARLRVELRTAGRSMNGNDAWIAATALAWQLPLATQDADFDVVAGLTVMRV